MIERRPQVALRWLLWLAPGLEIKRWLLLLGAGILILELGAAYLLKDFYEQTNGLPSQFYWLTLQFFPRSVRALIFGAAGVGLVIYAFYKLQRSVLGPFLPGTNQRGMADLLYTYRSRNRGPRLAVVGGGTGMSTLLRGLKEYSSNLAAIVTVADDGGSSGRLRAEYRILPPGDIRQCLVALADAEPLVKELFSHRFSEGSLNGHSFGNLFITAMAEVTGNFEHAIRESGRVLAVRGTIIPSTLHDVTLVASIGEDVIEGESRIPQQNSPINRVFLKPDGIELNPEAAQALTNAEIIIIGPGSLYTSILPNLLVPGMIEAIRKSPALKVFVCNVASQAGETDNYTVHDYLKVIEEHVGDKIFDFLIVNSNFNHQPTGGQSKVTFDRDLLTQSYPVPRLIEEDVVNTKIPSHHDPAKLAKVVMKRVWHA